MILAIITNQVVAEQTTAPTAELRYGRARRMKFIPASLANLFNVCRLGYGGRGFVILPKIKKSKREIGAAHDAKQNRRLIS